MKKYLEFFGGSYMDLNQIFIEEKNYKFILDFYKSLNLPAKLIFTQKDPFTLKLPQDNFNYFFNTQRWHAEKSMPQYYFSNIAKCGTLCEISNSPSLRL